MLNVTAQYQDRCKRQIKPLLRSKIFSRQNTPVLWLLDRQFQVYQMMESCCSKLVWLTIFCFFMKEDILKVNGVQTT